MQDELEGFFRCKERDGAWVFEVAVVNWTGQYPRLNWRRFREWPGKPTSDQLQESREAALQDPEYFGTCERCGEICNVGHMHDPQTCQSCAERELGVVY